MSRIFHDNTGLTTKSFLQAMRIQLVCEKLWRSDMAVSDLAFELGYFDQAHLLNDFKDRLKVSPKELVSYFMSDFSNKSSHR
ncbi:helix-turn-helix domain-containing protein [Vibrio sonorensis]|uniref:helix-turn-helix domain-containing protein n=1 Tax=Vibrio sonorensis TaxID=1004316 RepID=UPI0008DB2D35|nr:helix-turn-helix domain-containing protein [Vibrio sonorensis]